MRLNFNKMNNDNYRNLPTVEELMKSILEKELFTKEVMEYFESYYYLFLSYNHF